MQETEASTDRGKRRNAKHAYRFWYVSTGVVFLAIVGAPLKEAQLDALTSVYGTMTAIVLPLIALLRGADAYFNRSQK